MGGQRRLHQKGDIWAGSQPPGSLGKSIAGRGNRKCKGPEVPSSSEVPSRVEGHKQGVSGWRLDDGFRQLSEYIICPLPVKGRSGSGVKNTLQGAEPGMGEQVETWL